MRGKGTLVPRSRRRLTASGRHRNRAGSAERGASGADEDLPGPGVPVTASVVWSARYTPWTCAPGCGARARASRGADAVDASIVRLDRVTWGVCVRPLAPRFALHAR